MRVLALGLDGGDYDFVRRLLADGKLPTLGRLAREGAFGPLRSTVPTLTPTAWSSFLTGLNPAGHGIFNFASNPNRDRQRIESAASRAGTPLWRALGRAGIRSAFVAVPFTYPAETIDGIVVTGYGGPDRPQILPAEASERIYRECPDLVTAYHPMAERWWENFERYARKQLLHVEQIAHVCRIALELEPELGLLCVDFMSSDHMGHLGFHRLDPDHPAHDPAEAGDELVQVYEAIDRACGELIDEARARFGEEPTVLILSDHGMKPIYWTFHANRWLEENGHLRYRRHSLQRLKGGRADFASKVDQRLARTTRWYGRSLDLVPFVPPPRPDRTFADVDFGRTRAYCFATGGQIFLGEATGAARDPRYADRLAGELGHIRHPATGEPAFDVLRKEELFHGPFLERAPELTILPHDERIHVDSTRRDWAGSFERHERLDPAISYGVSGHHALEGILAAAGPGIRPSEVPPSAELVQLPATLVHLFGLELKGVDGAPIEAILADGAAKPLAVERDDRSRRDESVYSEEEERLMIDRLRDLGYE